MLSFSLKKNKNPCETAALYENGQHSYFMEKKEKLVS